MAFTELTLRVKVAVPDRAEWTLNETANGIRPVDVGAVSDHTRLTGGGWQFRVLSMERADGLPFGLDQMFEDYWDDTHCDGDEYRPLEKLAQRDAFIAGYKKAKRTA